MPLLAERASLLERSLEREDLIAGVQLIDPIDSHLLDADAVLVF